MSSLTNSLLGRNRSSVQEFTGVAGVPTVDGAGPALNVKPKPQLRKKDPADKRKLKEDDDGSIIPGDAEEVASTQASVVPTDIGDAQTGLSGQPGEREGGEERNPNILSPSLALVAPDCTPGWDRMLSPTLLPKGEKPAAQPAAPTSEPVSATVPAKSAGPASATDMLKLTRPGSGGGDQSLESQARNLVSSVVQEDASGGSTPIPMSEEALLGQGKPMPEHKPSNTSGKLLGRFNFTGK
jgi:hypothetical protein